MASKPVLRGRIPAIFEAGLANQVIESRSFRERSAWGITTADSFPNLINRQHGQPDECPL